MAPFAAAASPSESPSSSASPSSGDATDQLTETLGGASANDWLLALVIMVVALIASRGARRLVRRAFSKIEGAPPPIVEMLGRLAGWFVVTFGFVLALAALGMDLAPMLLLLLILVLLVAVSGRSMAQNFTAGLLLQIRGPFRVGDEISSQEVEGTVEQINARSTVLRQSDGSVLHIPNSLVTGEKLVNLTERDERRSTIRVGVGCDSDLETAVRTLAEAAQGCDEVLASPEPSAWVEEFGSSSIVIKLQFWHGSTSHAEKVAIHQVAMALKTSLERAGIEMPFPQLDVHHSQGGSDPGS